MLKIFASALAGPKGPLGTCPGRVQGLSLGMYVSICAHTMYVYRYTSVDMLFGFMRPTSCILEGNLGPQGLPSTSANSAPHPVV